MGIPYNRVVNGDIEIDIPTVNSSEWQPASAEQPNPFRICRIWTEMPVS
jgi:hypothetical protein